MDHARILLIDDEKYTLKLLEKIFNSYAYEITAVQSGKEAFEKLQSLRPDLIILDIIMPEMDGLQVLQHLKKEDETRDIPVVALTSYQDLDMKLTVLKEGAIDYLTKPFQKEELIYRVRNILKHSGPIVDEPEHPDVLDEIFPDTNEWLEPEICAASQYGYTFENARDILQTDELGVVKQLDQWVADEKLSREFYDFVVLCPVCDHYQISMHEVCPHCYAGMEDLKSSRCRHCHTDVEEQLVLFKCINCGKESSRSELKNQKLYRYKRIERPVEQKNIEITPRMDESILLQALEETQVLATGEKQFRDRIHKEIERAQSGNYNLTVMSIHTTHLDKIVEKYGRAIALKLMKSIILVVKKFMRKYDVLSYNQQQHVLLLLPQMHYNMAKILAEKIQSYFDKITQEVELVVQLASYPEDGYNENEVLAMLDVGIEVVKEKFTP